ncbi:MAG: hypothetical protein QOG21_141 [Actinomycetota bacterium]|jgi:hypothetical protein|nr:hypothetical protein [Actinomycetota bacterium]
MLRATVTEPRNGVIFSRHGIGIVILLGVLGIALAIVISARSLDITDAHKLAASYRAHLFLAFALNEIPLLIAFILCFLRGEWWPEGYQNAIHPPTNGP